MLSSCRLEVFCHATEEEGRVLQALRNALPANLGEKKPDVERLRGLYGNQITKFSIRLGRRRESRDFVEHLKNNLSEEDRRRLVLEAPERIDGNGFFFRLDKGEAYNGRLKIVTDGDYTIGVRLTIEMFGKKNKVLDEIGNMFSNRLP